MKPQKGKAISVLNLDLNKLLINQITNSLLNLKDVQQEVEVSTTESIDFDEKCSDKLLIDEKIEEERAPKPREPKCTKCRNHGLILPKKNHKGRCHFEQCQCPKCRIIDERREVLKEQVRIRRKFDQKEKALIDQTINVSGVETHLPSQQPISIQIPKPSIPFVPKYSSLTPLLTYPYRYSQMTYSTESSNSDSYMTYLTESSNSDSYPPQTEGQEIPVNTSYKYYEWM
jgi:hypothetical protein